MVEHPSGPALHAVLEGSVHVADAAPVNVVRLEAQVARALRGHVAPLRRGQEAVKAVWSLRPVEKRKKKRRENGEKTCQIGFFSVTKAGCLQPVEKKKAKKTCQSGFFPLTA